MVVNIDKLTENEKITMAITSDIPEILEKLANSENYMIRVHVATNLNTPSETLNKLANDEHEFVRQNVALNTAAKPELIEKLANDKNFVIQRNAILNPSTPIELLKKLAKSENPAIRWNVASNPFTPIETLKQLKDDADKNVSETATEKYIKRLQQQVSNSQNKTVDNGIDDYQPVPGDCTFDN